MRLHGSTVYFGPKTIMIPPPLSENDIFPLWRHAIFDSCRTLFTLILPYFAFIFPFYFLFSLFLSPFPFFFPLSGFLSSISPSFFPFLILFRPFPIYRPLWAVLWIRNYLFRIRILIWLWAYFGSGSGSVSGLFMKNTFELQICRSSKHHKKADFFQFCTFLDSDCWWKIHMNLKSVHFYNFVLVSWKQNLTRIQAQIRIRK